MDSTLVQRAKETDLLALAERYTTLRRVANIGGGEWAGPCPFCGGRDRFHVQKDTGRWLCRHCTEGYQDAIAFQMRLANQTFPQAVEALTGGADLPPAPARPRAAPTGEETHGPPSAQWQARARQVVEEAAAALWGTAGAKARAWLNARGLADETIRAARLGLIPEDRREAAGLWGLTGKDVYLARGILIPCEAGGAAWYLKVRRPIGEPKYLQARGGRPALYGAESLAGREAAVFTEGEFDTLLLWQEAGDLAGVVTLGSASNRLDVARWGLYLLSTSRRYLAFDLDPAGERGAAALGWLKGAQRLEVPRLVEGGKDLTDFHQHGGDLRAWLASCLGLSEETAQKKPVAAFPGEPGHLSRPDPLALVQSHPAYIPGRPISLQPVEVEEAWWAAVFAERGLADPAPLEALCQ